MEKIIALLIVIVGIEAACLPDCTYVAIEDSSIKTHGVVISDNVEMKILAAEIEFLSAELGVPAAVGFSQPLDSISINYGYHTKENAIADPITGTPRVHRAIDFDCNVGSMVYSITRAIVIKTGQDDRSGKYILIAFHDMEGHQYGVLYAHLDSVAVERGQVVEAGELIALGGNTGRSTGAHLHLEVRKLIRDKKGKLARIGFINPTNYFLLEAGGDDFCAAFCCGEVELLAYLQQEGRV